MGPQIHHLLHKLPVSFDNFLCDVEFKFGNHLFSQGLDISIEPVLLRFIKSLVKEQGCGTEVLQLFWGYPNFLSIFKLSIDVITGLHSLGKLLYKLKNDRAFLPIFIKIFSEFYYFFSKVLLLFLSPFFQCKFAVIPNQNICKAFFIKGLSHCFWPFWFRVFSFNSLSYIQCLSSGAERTLILGWLSFFESRSNLLGLS